MTTTWEMYLLTGFPAAGRDAGSAGGTPFEALLLDEHPTAATSPRDARTRSGLVSIFPSSSKMSSALKQKRALSQTLSRTPTGAKVR